MMFWKGLELVNRSYFRLIALVLLLMTHAKRHSSSIRFFGADPDVAQQVLGLTKVVVFSPT